MMSIAVDHEKLRPLSGQASPVQVNYGLILALLITSLMWATIAFGLSLVF